MQAPCARYCIIGCAASPSSVARPSLQRSTGSRSAVAQRRHEVGRSSSWRGRGCDALEVRQHLFLAAVGHAPLLLLAAVEGHDQVVLLAAAQRVVDQVAVGAGPDDRRVPAQVLGHVGASARPRGRRRGPRRARASPTQLRAHHRLDAVAADERRRPRWRAAVAGDRGHAVLADAPGARPCAEVCKRITRMLLHRLVDAPCRSARWLTAYGIAEALAEGLAHRHRGDLAAVDRIHHHQALGEHGAGARTSSPTPSASSAAKALGPELQAGADLADGGALLQQLDRDAQARERERGGQAADAAAGRRAPWALGTKAASRVHQSVEALLRAARPWPAAPDGRKS